MISDPARTHSPATTGSPDSTPQASPTRILSIDVGGTGVKGALIDSFGEFLTEKFRVKTPELKRPADLWELIGQIVAKSPPFEAISVGFPGVLRRGEILTCPTLRSPALLGANLEKSLSDRFHVPVRALNDAAVQALPAVTGTGIEMVITLGTGFGFALFEEGRLGPRLEMSTHVVCYNKTYNKFVGDAALKKQGPEKWRERVRRVILELKRLSDYDRLFIGGGNARILKKEDITPEIHLISNEMGIKGGAWLWRDHMWTHFKHWTPFEPQAGTVAP